MSEDQRRHPRVPIQQNVWVEGQDVRISAQTRNISKGGMFVVSEGDAPAVGTTVQITFEDPHEGKVNLKMEVVWRDERTAASSLGLRAVESTDKAAFDRVVSRIEQSVSERVGRHSSIPRVSEPPRESEKK
ncbi:MAG: PilZ domain-containing protein [Polyangiales bacterium]